MKLIASFQVSLLPTKMMNLRLYALNVENLIKLNSKTEILFANVGGY